MRDNPQSPAGHFSLVLNSTWQLAGLLSLPVLLWLAWQLRAIIALALLTLLLAIGLAPGMVALERCRVPRPLAIVLLYLGILVPVGGFLFVAGNIVVAQSQALLVQVPKLLARWQALAAGNPLLSPPQALQDLLSSGSLRLAGGGITALVAGLLILVVTYYLLAEGERLWFRALGLVPTTYRAMVDLLGREIAQKARGYLLGVVLSALVIGVVTGLGLWLLGVPYPFFFGVLAGVLEVVPLIGPALAAVGPLLLALSQSPLQAGLVLLFFVVLQQLEDKLLVVRVQSHTTGLHPLVVIFSLLALGALFGVSGMVLAVPIAAALQATLVCLNHCIYHPGGSAAWLAERQADRTTDTTWLGNPAAGHEEKNEAHAETGTPQPTFHCVEGET